MLGDLDLVLVGGWVSDAVSVLGSASVVVDIKGRHRGYWLLITCVKSANLLLNLGEFGCLRILDQVVLEFCGCSHVLLNGVEEL